MSDRPDAANMQPGPDAPKGGRSLRAHDRYDWNEQCEICWLVDDQPTDAVELECVDLGLGGVSVMSPVPIAVGTRGAALLRSEGQIGRIRALEVVHCRFDPNLGAHVLGGKWLAELAGVNHLVVKQTKAGPRLMVREASPREEQASRGAA